MIIGDRLRTVRKSQRLSQGDIEKKTGLLRCYVSRVENLHTTPSVDTLEKWSKALGVSMSQLFSDNGETANPMPVFKTGNTRKLNRAATNHLRRIGNAFSRMTPRDMALVTGMAQKLAARK